MRYAIFYTPTVEDPLSRVAASWLGTDIFGGDPMPWSPSAAMSEDERRHLIEAPSRYGFHATLKAPFTLTEGMNEAALIDAFDRLAEAAAPIYLGPLDVTRLDGFYALRPRTQSHGLNEFAFRVVKWFEPFRSLPTAEELARRRKVGLTPRQDALLIHWGYPFVGDEFRFHMTLTGQVEEGARARVGRYLEQAFGPLAEDNTLLDTIALAVEPVPDAPFTVIRQAELGVVTSERRMEA